MILTGRNALVLASIGGALLSLSLAPGGCRRGIGAGEKAIVTDTTPGAGNVGVTVTKDVPHSRETTREIRDRETTHPLPARGDMAIHSHEIPRPGTDNAMTPDGGAIPR